MSLKFTTVLKKKKKKKVNPLLAKREASRLKLTYLTFYSPNHLNAIYINKRTIWIEIKRRGWRILLSCYQMVHVLRTYLHWGVVSSVAALSRLMTSSVRRSSVAITAGEENQWVFPQTYTGSFPLKKRKVTKHNTQILLWLKYTSKSIYTNILVILGFTHSFCYL